MATSPRLHAGNKANTVIFNASPQSAKTYMYCRRDQRDNGRDSPASAAQQYREFRAMLARAQRAPVEPMANNNLGERTAKFLTMFNI